MPRSSIGDNRCSFLSSRTSWTMPRRRARGAILPAVAVVGSYQSAGPRSHRRGAIFFPPTSFLFCLAPRPSSSFSPQYSPLSSSSWDLSVASSLSLLFSLSETAVGRKTAALVSSVHVGKWRRPKSGNSEPKNEIDYNRLCLNYLLNPLYNSIICTVLIYFCHSFSLLPLNISFFPCYI